MKSKKTGEKKKKEQLNDVIKLRKPIHNKVPVYFTITKYLMPGTLETREGCLDLDWSDCSWAKFSALSQHGRELTKKQGVCEEAREQKRPGLLNKPAFRRTMVKEARLAHF